MAQRQVTARVSTAPRSAREDGQAARGGRTGGQTDSAARATQNAKAEKAGQRGEVSIERLILHHLDHRAGQCDLVDAIATLDETSQRFFSSHVASAAERADWHARFRADDDAVPAQLSALLGDDDQFVHASRALAERLYRYMSERSGNIAPGDFVAIAYHIGDEPERHVALLKMDPDQQRLARRFTRHGSGWRVAISLADNLLPEAKALQKCALISRDATRDGAAVAGGSFRVRLLDTQAGPRSDGVAAFFYRDFLAASLTASARRQTRLFLSETNSWLASYGAAFQPRELLAFFAARRQALAGEVVRLRAFAAAALPQRPDLREELTRRLIGSVLDDPDLQGAHPFFPVDRAAAKSYLEKVTLELDGGMRLTMSAARFEELVRVAEERTEEGKLRLTLDSLA
ncbi:MAG TPA: nucleoid-associated protein, partial [Ktedonobacterales bacterium]|nr:nucleoid-associated protein [Ktedonobacterales bacterium]